MESKIQHNPALNNFIKIPEAYLCPISGMIMIEPVILDDGFSYESEQISQWLLNHVTSPMTGVEVNKGIMIPNRNLKSEISEFLSRHPAIHYSDETYMPRVWVSDLVNALKQNKQDEVKKLLDKDKRLLIISLEGEYTAWHLAAQYGSLELAGLLLRKLLHDGLLNTLKEKETPFGFEARYIQPLFVMCLEEIDGAMCSGLLQLGANPEQVDPKSGDTLLHIMIKRGSFNAVNWLLEKGVDAMHVNCMGDTPLHTAVLQGRSDMVELLLTHGATCIKNHQHQTPIVLAVLNQEKEILRHFLKLQDSEGNTALHLAVQQEDDALVSLLLRAGFDPYLRNHKGVTSMDLGKTTRGLALQQFCFFRQGSKPMGSFQMLSGHTDIVYCLEKLGNDGFASGSWDKSIKIWRAGQCVMTLRGHSHNVICLQHMREDFIASGSSDKTIKLWDLKTQRCVDTLSGHTGTIRCLQRLDATYLASGSSDKTIKIWDVNFKKCVKTLEGHTDSINALTLCVNGQLASGSWDSCIKIWDVQAGRCVQTLKGHEGVVRCLLPLANGQLISGSRDKTIKIWDVAQGTCLATLTGHTDSVNCLYLLGDRYLCSGAWDKTIRVWDLLTQTLVNTCEGHTGAVNSFILGEGGILFSSSDDKSIKGWSSVMLLPKEKTLSTLNHYLA